MLKTQSHRPDNVCYYEKRNFDSMVERQNCPVPFCLSNQYCEFIQMLQTHALRLLRTYADYSIHYSQLSFFFCNMLTHLFMAQIESERMKHLLRA